jgi:hypothetical protein
MEVCYRYTYEDSLMKPNKYCLKRKKAREANRNIVKGVNLFKVYCMHIWNHHNYPPCIINGYQFKNKIKIVFKKRNESI